MSKRKDTPSERQDRQRRMYKGVVVATYEERTKVIDALRESGFELCRQSKHGTVFKHPAARQKINVPFKLNDRNRAQKLLRGVGLDL